jgi:hypothetical protein
VSVVVVMPSRGRPSRAHAAIAAIRGTAARVDTRVVLAVDEDDPELEAYRALRWDPIPYAAEVALVELPAGETGDLVRATNTVAMRIATEDPGCVIGNLGDDHVARTPAWDRRVLEALDEPGIAYGDDGSSDASCRLRRSSRPRSSSPSAGTRCRRAGTCSSTTPGGTSARRRAACATCPTS